MGAIGTAAAIAAQGVNMIREDYWNARNENFAREQNQLNRDWALNQWNRENAYNNPVAQMQRLKSAGLNPMLMYGNGAGSLLAAPSHSPEQTTTQGRASQGLNMKDAMEAGLMQSQQDLIESQVKKNLADAKEAESRIPVHQQEVEKIKSLINLYGEQGKLYASQADLNEKYGKKVGEEIYKLQLENQQHERSMDDILRKISAEADKAEYDADMARQLCEQYSEQLQLQRENLKAQAYAAIQSGRLSAAEADKVRAEIRRYDDVVNAQIADLNASASEHDANVRSKDAQTETENAMRDSKVKLAKKEARYAGFKTIADGSSKLINSTANLVNSFKPGVSINKTTSTIQPSGMIDDAPFYNSMFD